MSCAFSVCFDPARARNLSSPGLIGLESFCSIVESLAPWTEKTPVEKRATRTDYEEVVAEAADSERESSGSARSARSRFLRD